MSCCKLFAQALKLKTSWVSGRDMLSLGFLSSRLSLGLPCIRFVIHRISRNSDNSGSNSMAVWVQMADLRPGSGAAGITEIRASAGLGVSGELRGSTNLRVTIGLFLNG